MGYMISWTPAALLSLVLKLSAIFFGTLFLKVVWRAYTIRRKFRQVRAQGIPMLPHSWITGHLNVMFEFRKEYPGDINIGNFHPWIINNYRRYFPDMDHCPPVIYLDLWPVLRSPIVAAYRNTVAAQFTQVKNLDKHQISLDFMNPLTKGKDIATLQGEDWKKWRGWLNPGFSSRNVSTMVPELIEEIKVFAENLRQKAGQNGSWGPMFQFRNMTTALTFDIIVRASLDERLHEQTNPTGGPLRVALADQLRLMGIRQAFSFGYLFPWQNKAVDRNNQIVHNQLYPNIVRSVESGLKPSKKKTVLNLALTNLAEEAGGRPVNPATDPDMMETIISNLKTFLVAGHETTASALCFMFKVLQDNPECMAKVRAEHDEVLGPDPDQAAEILSNSPQLLGSLRYTHAVIKETLRMYQMASTMRGGEAGFYLNDPESGRQYPTEGFLVWDGGPGMQLDPSLWPHVDKFIPDRWLVPAEDPLHPVKDTWRAFARGPRDCIGQEVALVEIKLVAALIMRKFDVEEAWEDWDIAKGLSGKKDMVRGQRLYVAGDGIGHPKDGMPVHNVIPSQATSSFFNDMIRFGIYMVVATVTTASSLSTTPQSHNPSPEGADEKDAENLGLLCFLAMAVDMRSRPLLLLLCAVSAVLGQTVTVESNGVRFLGVEDESSGVNNFLGIRYAEAPVGNLRWRPPVPVRYDTDSDAVVHINATTYGPNCVSTRPSWSSIWEFSNDKKKRSHRRKSSHAQNSEDEDCLVLNIQTPITPKSKRLPVLVYIHGGGYVGGSAYPVNGNSLMAQSEGSIIHVQLQYRLGALGFLSGDEVKDDGTANAGLLDQRLALRWIRDNIHVFGGDPTRITISGSSAGGGSVAMQMVMFGGSEEAPFQAAILDFPWWSPMYGREWQQNQYRTLLRAARCSSLTCLRKASLARIISATEEASQKAYNKKEYAHGTFYWGPVADGRVLVRHPVREFRDGRFTKIPVLTTRSYDEGFVFTNTSVQSDADAVADLSTLWREEDGFFAKTLMMLYPSTVYNRSHLDTFNRRGGAQFLKLVGHPLSDAFVRLSAIFGDAFINCPTSHAARHVVKYGQPAYKLVFKAGYECHGSPLSFLYSEYEDADGQQHVGDLTFPGNATLADRLRSFWISFAIHRDPNAGRYCRIPAPSWPEYDLEDPRVLWVEQTSMRTRPDPDDSANCQFFHDCRGNKCGLVKEW